MPQLTLCELGPDAYGVESLSPFCLKVHRALRWHGLPYERRHAVRPSEHKAYNPSGQVPVLLIDTEAVPDSTAILQRLEMLSDRSLVPNDARERADAWLWEDYADGVLAFYVFAARWYDDRNWEMLRAEQFGSLPGILRGWFPAYLRKRILRSMRANELIRAGQSGCWQRFCVHLDMLEARAPATGFWASESVSVADISLFGVLHCLRAGISPWQRDRIRERPQLSAWLDRVDAVTRG